MKDAFIESFDSNAIDFVTLFFVCTAIVMLGIIFAQIAWAFIVFAAMACSRTCRDSMLSHQTQPARQEVHPGYRDDDDANHQERLLDRNPEPIRYRHPQV